MRILRSTLPVLLVAGVVSSTLYLRLHVARAAGVNSSQAGNASCCSAGGSAVGLRELDFPYYSLRDGFGSQLKLVSDSPKPIDLTLVIYSERGQSVMTSATIQPSARLDFDLHSLLTGLGADINGEFGGNDRGRERVPARIPGLSDLVTAPQTESNSATVGWRLKVVALDGPGRL
jgi:hypothetical protein